MPGALIVGSGFAIVVDAGADALSYGLSVAAAAGTVGAATQRGLALALACALGVACALATADADGALTGSLTGGNATMGGGGGTAG